MGGGGGMGGKELSLIHSAFVRFISHLFIRSSTRPFDCISSVASVCIHSFIHVSALLLELDYQCFSAR